MQLTELKDITFSEKKKLVESACAIYKKFLVAKKFLIEKQKIGYQLNDENKSDQNFKNLSLFETLLNLLSKEHYLIIKKEFIDLEEKDNFWWEDHWSKTTFYKLKHEAIDNFLFLFYI